MECVFVAAPEFFPSAATLAWWGTGWLQGQVGADEVIRAVPGVGIIDLLAEARLTGAGSVGLALPTEGDLLGLGGPVAFNDAALAHGQAAIADSGIGWVPVGQGWERHSASRRQVPDVGEADRELRRVLVEASDALAALDVASWRPEAADALMEWRRPVDLSAPVGTPTRCVELAAKALRAREVVDLALGDDGAAVTGYEIDARRAVLGQLDRSARRALVAACSPEVWPPR